jgi:acyl-CoA reductase-like NAD-dependent aldehyde dehydrogenase
MAAQMTLRAGSGQGCNLPTRVLVQDTVYREFLDRIATNASSIRPGDPFDPATQMGPVINEAACRRILGVIERAIADGARLVTGGSRVQGELAGGYFIEPTGGGGSGGGLDRRQRVSTDAAQRTVRRIQAQRLRAGRRPRRPP